MRCLVSRGKVISFVVVSTKITISRDLGTWATCKHNKSIKFGEKLASVCFKSTWFTSINCLRQSRSDDLRSIVGCFQFYILSNLMVVATKQFTLLLWFQILMNVQLGVIDVTRMLIVAIHLETTLVSAEMVFLEMEWSVMVIIVLHIHTYTFVAFNFNNYCFYCYLQRV